MLLSLPWAPLVAQLVKNLPAMQETLVLIPGSKRSAGEGDGYPLQYSWVSWVAQLVKNPPAIRETWVWCLGEGNGYPFQYSDLENTMDRIELGVTKSWTPPTFTFLLSSKQFDFAELWVHHYSFSFHLYFEERWASFQKIKPLHSLFFFVNCIIYLFFFRVAVFFFFSPVIWFQFVAVTVSVYVILSRIKPNSLFRVKRFLLKPGFSKGRREEVMLTVPFKLASVLLPERLFTLK